MNNNKSNEIQEVSNVKKFMLMLAVSIGLIVLTFTFQYASQINYFSIKVIVFYSIYVAISSLVFLACFIEKRKVSELGFTKNQILKQILIGIGIAIVLSFLIGALPILLSNKKTSFIGDKPASTLEAVFSIATALIFIGFMEELIFRGYFQVRIEELIKNKLFAVFMAAFLFGIWHIINGSWTQVFFTFIIGGIFGLFRAYFKNCSLLSVIIAHGLYDALLVVIALILL